MRLFKSLLSIILIVVSVTLVWSVLIEPRLIDEKELTVGIPNLPPDWNRKKVALISDFQIGMWLDNEGTIIRIVDQLVERRPAAVLITGDFIYRPSGFTYLPWVEKLDRAATEQRVDELIQRNIDILNPLVDAGIPTYAVLGNHDYEQAEKKKDPSFWIAEEVAEALEANGIDVLQNEAVTVRAETGTDNSLLYFIGIGAYYPNQDDVTAALDGVPADAPRLVFFHHPETFLKLPAGTAPLAVAGHTHGGQIRIPWTESWSWLRIVSKGEIYADGWIDGFGAPGNNLYVNRGIGFSMLPVRLNCPPELTLFTLETGKPGMRRTGTASGAGNDFR